MTITEVLKSRRLILDGATGTELQKLGLAPGELTETWNLSHPEKVEAVHRSYFDAGSDAVCSNTFGANPIKHANAAELVRAGVKIARAAALEAEKKDGKRRFVLLDIGPLGKLLKPYGELDFEDAVNAFAETVRAGEGADAVYFETFTDIYELKAGILAAKENTDLPIFASCAFDATGHLMTGADAGAVAVTCEGLGVTAFGANCGVGPDLLLPVSERFAELASIPVICKPNAGLPRSENGKTVFDVTPEIFAADMRKLAENGAVVLGGCCGTTPAHIRALVDAVSDVPFKAPEEKDLTLVSSYSHAVEIGKSPILIGERINPTGKKAFREALKNHDISYVLGRGIEQENAGAHILDVNVGTPEIDEPSLLCECVAELQSVIGLPLQIDTSNPDAMERALRIYNGKPLINSVNGKTETMKAVFPLAKKYGGVVVGLTLDENGIPDSAEGRADIAGRIIAEAEKYGISRKNIIIDTLTMTVATDKNAANITLDAVKLVRERYGVATCLGVSNVSFGLPNRDKITSSFFTLALAGGLSAAIMNPLSEPVMSAYRTYLAVSGNDDACAGYIAAETSVPAETAPSSPAEKKTLTLAQAVESGMKQAAGELAGEELKSRQPMEIVNDVLVPALSKVGEDYAAGKVFLPGLLMSAEAASAAFAVIRASIGNGAGEKKEKIILATVRGDIHDIGKNIVRALLENYNYDVIDLGRDVPPETVVDTAERENVKLVGLSALMTTTVPAMAETVKLLKERLPDVKTVVGGAVLTQDYADMIGADKYSPDAMDTVRYAEKLFGH